MLKSITGKVSVVATLAGAMVSPVAAFAQPLVPTQLSQNAEIVPIIQAIIRFILIVAFIIAFIMLLVGGIRWILAGGDEKAVAGARNTITAALIGLVIVLVSYAIIRLVEIFFNVTIISGTIDIRDIGVQGSWHFMLFLSLIIIQAVFVKPVYAVDDPAAISDIVPILQNVIKLLAPTAGIAFFIMLLIGGFQFVTSGGDPKAAGKARATLTYAVIGIILVIASWLILKLIANLTGADVTEVKIP